MTVNRVLADGIHMACVREDIVVLDVPQDAYSCLRNAAAWIHQSPNGGLRIKDAGLVDVLGEAGLVTEGPIAPRRDLPERPSISFRRYGAGQPTFKRRTRFLTAAARTTFTYPTCSLQTLMQKVRSGSEALSRDPEALSQEALLFERWLPWVPFQGVCLYRCWFLLNFLRSAGLTADWVFGVQTWPFSAHCWLQAGPLLLDDDLDRVGLYAPILVV